MRFKKQLFLCDFRDLVFFGACSKAHIEIMLDRSNYSYCKNVTATQMKFIHAWVHRHPAIPSYNPWNMHEQWLSSVKLPLTISYREKEWPGHVSLLRKTRQYIHDGDNHNAQDDNKWKVIINSQCDWPRILTVMLIGLSNFNLWYLFFCLDGICSVGGKLTG